MVKSDVETTPSSDDGSETNHRRHHSGFLDPIDTGTRNRTYRILGIAVQLHIGKCACASLDRNDVFCAFISIYSIHNHSVYLLVAQCIYDLAGIRKTFHHNLDRGSSVYQN